MKTPAGNPQFIPDVISAIQSVVGNGSVALHEPEFDGNELIYLSPRSYT